MLEALPDFDQPRLAKNIEMPAEVSVRQRAQTFQFRKEQAFGTRHQRGHDPEPGFLVKDALQPVVCEPSGLFVTLSLLLASHRFPRAVNQPT